VLSRYVPVGVVATRGSAVSLKTRRKTHASWGVQPNSSFKPVTRNYTCPNGNCTFAFFCLDDHARPAATIWRNSVVGFKTFDDVTKNIKGVAVLHCPICSEFFTLPLRSSDMEAYQRDSERWPVDSESCEPHNRW